MKVTQAGGAGQAPGAKQTRGVGGEGFRLPQPASAQGVVSTAATSAPSSVVGLASLLALQDVGTPLERRRRSVARAGRILDVLDEIKIALLDGDLSSPQLDRLRRAVRDERAATDSPALEALLDQIETRAAVEAAKLELAARAA
jgi:Class II flagellar assembly regulator